MAQAAEEARFSLEVNGYAAELAARQVTADDPFSLSMLQEVSGRLPDRDLLDERVTQTIARGAMVWVVGGRPDFGRVTSPFVTYGLVQISPNTSTAKRLTGRGPDYRLDRRQAVAGGPVGLSRHALEAAKYAGLRKLDPDSLFHDDEPAAVDPNYHPSSGKIVGPIARGLTRTRQLAREQYVVHGTVDQELRRLEFAHRWLETMEFRPVAAAAPAVIDLNAAEGVDTRPVLA